MLECDVQMEVNQTRNWVNNKLKDISKLETEAFRKILYYSLIDSFAQSWKNYPTYNVQNVFSDFILTFSPKYRDILGNVCPVTLFHYLKDENPLLTLRLPESRILDAQSGILAKESERLLATISNQDTRIKAQKKHRYCQLMYAERNKLVHELSQVGMPIDFDEPLPHVAQGCKMIDDKLIDTGWELVIPEKFVLSVLEDVLNGYLAYCVQENIVPFSNNTFDRKSKTAWYD